MDIVIFSDLTTKDALAALKAEGEKYHGLYVDMHDPKARKYVKEQAQHIKDLKKRVDRKRIDAAKEYKIAVEKEAASIMEDLNIANSPFELLIDEYTAERKRVLDAEKAEKAASELAAQIEIDHEFALMLNEKFDLEQEMRKKEKEEYEAKLKEEAIKEQAAQAERDSIAAKQALEAAEARRLADIEQAKLDEQKRQAEQLAREQAEEARKQADVKHAASIHNAILEALIKNGIGDLDARTMIKLAAKNELPHIKINY